MNRPHLSACPSCARHVRVSESACPFCQSALGDAFRAAPTRPAPGIRLARAALFALGTGVTLTPACSSSSEPPILPGYGAAAYVDASVETESDGGPGSDAFRYEPETDGSGTPDAADASPSEADGSGTPDAADAGPSEAGDASASDAASDASPDAADAF